MVSRVGSILAVSILSGSLLLSGAALSGPAWAAKPGAEKPSSEAARVRLAIAARKGVAPHRLLLPTEPAPKASQPPSRGLRLGKRFTIFTRRATQTVTDLPKLVLPSRNWRTLSGTEPESFANRMAEKLTDFSGSIGYLVLTGSAASGWMAFNSLTANAPDPELFKMNVTISVATLMLQGVVMMSQKIAAKKDRVHAERDLAADLHTEQMVTELRDEVRDLKNILLAREQPVAPAKTE